MFELPTYCPTELPSVMLRVICVLWPNYGVNTGEF